MFSAGNRWFTAGQVRPLHVEEKLMFYRIGEACLILLLASHAAGRDD